MKDFIHLEGQEILEAAKFYLEKTRGKRVLEAVLMDPGGRTGTLDGVTLVCSVEDKKDRPGG